MRIIPGGFARTCSGYPSKTVFERSFIMPDWNASQYLKFEKQRTQPAIDLANRIGLTNPVRILDVGCGPGNSSRVLKDKYIQARVIGIDNSENMLEKARADHPDIEFRLCDASGDLSELGEGYDIVFSNACLQWVPDHERLLGRLMGLLRKGGVLAVQVPYNWSEPIHIIIVEISKTDRWNDYFPEKRIFHTLTPGEYFDILSGLTPDFEIWETTYYHVMESHEAILEWYRGTGLRPYLDALPDGKKSEFEKEVMDRLIEAYPKQKNGEIIFRFPRLFFTAVAR